MTITSQQKYQEYEEKQALKEKIAGYYRAQTTKNGLKSLDKILEYLPASLTNYHLHRGVAFAHLDFEKILECIAENKEFAVVSGLNPSAPLHLGHKALFDLLKYLEKLGGNVYIPITNDESVMDGKMPDLSASRKMAYEEVIPSIAAFGFDPRRTKIFVDSDYPDIYNFAMHLSKYVSLGEIKNAFGEDSLTHPGQVFYRGVVQMAQILLSQLPEFGGPKPTLIPVGIDQHPYLLLARDVAKRIGMVPPSELVLRFQPSLRDPEAKMSGSKPETAIYLNDSTERIIKKINRAYTGSVTSLEVHQEKGGIPEICSVFALLNFHHPDQDYVDTLYERYISGELLMKELKEEVTTFITTLVEDHQAQRQDAKLKNKYFLNEPLRSFLGKEYV